MLGSIVAAYMRTPRHRGKNRLTRYLLKMHGRRPVVSKYGPMLVNRPADLTNYFSISGVLAVDYDDVFQEVSRLERDMAFVDIGANAGLFSMVAAKRLGGTGPVIAFEPSLTIYGDLVQNAILNDARVFFPFNAAIGRATELTRFDAGAEAHSGVARLDENGATTVLQLAYADLKPIIDPIIGVRKTIIKVDVEGAEEIVLSSILGLIQRPETVTVIVEIDEGNLRRFGGSSQGVYALMNEAGFNPRVGLGARPHYNEVFVRA